MGEMIAHVGFEVAWITYEPIEHDHTVSPHKDILDWQGKVFLAVMKYLSQ